MDTFKDLYVKEHNIAPSRFAHHVLGRCLRVRARFVYWPTRLFWRNLFEAELDLINNVGRLTNPFDLDLDITEYRYHPFNQSPLRRILGLKVSTKLLRRLVYSTFNADSNRTHSRKRRMPKAPTHEAMSTGPSNLVDLSRLT